MKPSKNERQKIASIQTGAVQHTLHFGYEQQWLEIGGPSCPCKLFLLLAHFCWHKMAKR